MKKADAETLLNYINETLDDGVDPCSKESMTDVYKLGIRITESEYFRTVGAVIEHRKTTTGSIGGLARRNPLLIREPVFDTEDIYRLDPRSAAGWALDVERQIELGQSPKMSHDMHIHASNELKDLWRNIAHQREKVWMPHRDICDEGLIVSRLVRGLVPG